MTPEQKQRAFIRMQNSYRLPVGTKVVIEDWHFKSGAYNGKVATIKSIGPRGPGIAHYTIIHADGEVYQIDSYFLMPLSLINQKSNKE